MQTVPYISQRMIHKITAALVVCAAIACQANAAMQDQPVPSAATIQKALQLSANIISERGDPARSRPQLLQLIEVNPTADLVEQFAPALRDANTYTSILATYDDALQNETTEDKSKPFIRFNMLRATIFRASYLTTSERRTFLKQPAIFAEELSLKNKGDAAVWDALGDLYAIKDDPDKAESAYRHSATVGGSRVRAQYKIAQAYRRIRHRDREALQAYEAGIRADAALSQDGGKEMRHLLYQGMGMLYLERPDLKNAVEALLSSARVRPDTDAPYRFRLDLAEALLTRGYAKEVIQFADAALKVAPDDEQAKSLKLRAEAASL